jgi:hypothetical protein
MTIYSEFILQYAQEHNLSYQEAMQQGKDSYHDWKQKEKLNETKKVKKGEQGKKLEQKKKQL